MTPAARQDTILEALIEGELAASETYRAALERLGERQANAGDLRRIEAEHRQAAGVLRERSRRPAPLAASAWATWTASAEPGAPQAKDERAAIGALKLGEESEIREYEAALENPALGDEFKRLIASMLLPQTRAHLQMLDRYARRTNGT